VTGSWKQDAVNQIDITTPQGNFVVTLNILGEHNAKNALAATAVALAAGLSNEVIQRGLEAFQPVTGRMQQHQLNQNTTVIDDSYNANPDSVRAAIDVLSSTKTPAWLVLGDMGEVGEKGPEFHSEVGAYAGEKGIQKLFATGELSKSAVSAYLAKATVGGSAKHFDQMSDLCADVKNALTQRTSNEATTVLVKGSRFMRMEQVVKSLTEEIH
jgi:UDP-N-acetylmuramoyl-tripeptide--D-alanyl-D-alanine ligase